MGVSSAHAIFHSNQELSACQELASSDYSHLNINITDAGTLQIEGLNTGRSSPSETLEHLPCQAQAPSIAKNLDLSAPARRIANIEQWLAHLLVLKAMEERKAIALKACWPNEGVHHIFTPASESLFDFIDSLQVLLERLRREAIAAKDQDQEEAAQELALLWEEIRESQDAAAESGFRARVDGLLRGKKLTRSQRRTAFKRSQYSYRSTSFRGSFRRKDGTNIEPDLAPLSDEVSLSIDCQITARKLTARYAQDSEDESFYTSDGESGSDTDDSEESDDESDQPPLKRVKTSDENVTYSLSN